jgi:hypothetical protein
VILLPSKQDYLQLLRRLPKASIVEREGIIARIREITTTQQDGMDLLEAIEDIYLQEQKTESVKAVLDILEKFGNSVVSKTTTAPSIEIVPVNKQQEKAISGERFGNNRARRGVGTKKIRGNSYIIGNTAFVEASLIFEEKIRSVPNPKGIAVPRSHFVDSSINFETFDFSDIASYTPHIAGNDILLPLIPKKYSSLAEGYFSVVYYMKDWSIQEKDGITYVSNTLFNPDNNMPVLYQTTAFQIVDNKIVPVALVID